MIPTSRRYARAALSGALALCACAAFAQQPYPSKPIRIISPYAPGGSTSTIARLIGYKMTESWGQQVLIDNRPGGSTVIGSEALVRSPADGYTLIVVTSTHTINANLMKLPFDPVKDFAPVSTLSNTGYVLVVHPSLPVKNLREFIALAKSRPGQIDYASSGTGGANHLATELLCMLAGIKMQHIPYKGGGPALTDVLGGQVQVHMNVPTNLLANIKNGRLRALAVTGESRLAAAPEIPTFAEAGLPQFTSGNWNGILAPAGTPRPIIDKLAAEIAKILQMPDIREKLQSQGVTAWINPPDRFAALIKSEIATFGQVIKSANIKLE
jgi:tripartite-type tricarboxylate transporter receptor subunit TctC